MLKDVPPVAKISERGISRKVLGMKSQSILGAVALCATLAAIHNAPAQGVLDRLESGIRGANGQPLPPSTLPPATVPLGQRSYLGAVADDSGGRGVRVLSVRTGGPADRSGLQPQDLVLGAQGRRLRQLTDLTTILAAMSPGDKLSLEIVRGNRPLHVDVMLGSPPGATEAPGLLPPGSPPPNGLGAGKTEAIPAPPPEGASSSPPLLPTPEGPAFAVPSNIPNQPVPINSPQAQIDALTRRVDQLERRIQELERELAATQRK